MNTNRKIGTLMLVEVNKQEEYFNPIIICDDEIKVGDSVTDGINIVQIKEGIKEISSCWAKVLVLPNQFSQEFLQAIVDGKVKDGDKVEVEMEFSHHTPESEHAYIQDLRDNRSLLVPVYKIKLRKDGTAIIHPYQESVEDAARKYRHSLSYVNNAYFECYKAFLAGAEWQKNQKK